MIKSHLSVERIKLQADLPELVDYRKEYRHDDIFLIRSWMKSFSQNHSRLWLAIKNIPEFKFNECLDPKHLTVGDPRPTMNASPNTAVDIILRSDFPLTGKMTWFYDRVSIQKYFGLTDGESSTEVDDKTLTIEWTDWKNAAKTGRLDELLHPYLAPKLGRTFSHQGGYYQDKNNLESAVLRSKAPLVCLIPSNQAIENGWMHMVNVKNEQKGSIHRQTLTIHLRVVSSDHLFIEDGELYIPIRLVRDTHHLNHKHEGHTHVD